jgi:hypothetical protein
VDKEERRSSRLTSGRLDGLGWLVRGAWNDRRIGNTKTGKYEGRTRTSLVPRLPVQFFVVLVLLYETSRLALVNGPAPSCLRARHERHCGRSHGGRLHREKNLDAEPLLEVLYSNGMAGRVQGIIV